MPRLAPQWLVRAVPQAPRLGTCMTHHLGHGMVRYHKSRKQIYQRRAKLASQAPDGVYSSHTKYADEAVRIKSTGRLAF